MLIRAGPELEMPKLRIDILEQARAIMQSYGDEQLLLWVHAETWRRYRQIPESRVGGAPNPCKDPMSP